MFDVKRTLASFERTRRRTDGTLGKISFIYARQSLKIVVTRRAEVRRSEAEENGDRAAVATFILEIIGAVLGTNLGAHKS